MANTEIGVLAYIFVALLFLIASYLWYPWDEPTRKYRFYGAFAQAIVWPLGLGVWILIWREDASDTSK